jgi:hypothetical protein
MRPNWRYYADLLLFLLHTVYDSVRQSNQPTWRMNQQHLAVFGRSNCSCLGPSSARAGFYVQGMVMSVMSDWPVQKWKSARSVLHGCNAVEDLRSQWYKRTNSENWTPASMKISSCDRTIHTLTKIMARDLDVLFSSQGEYSSHNIMWRSPCTLLG